MQGGIERTGYDESPITSGYQHLIEAILNWQHKLEILCSNSNIRDTTYRQDGGQVSSLVNEILSIITDEKEEHAIYAGRAILGKIFEVSSKYALIPGLLNLFP